MTLKYVRGWCPAVASSVELASARGLTPNMRLCGFILLFLLTCTVSTRETRLSTRHRSRRSQHEHGSRYKGAHHRPLTDAQKADKNLQFMLSLYRSAAGPDGRTKQHRKFGSNTVRLLRPTASSVRYLPATRDHHYSLTVQYNLDTLPSEQLVRASFVHLHSSSSSPSRCWAQLSSLGSGGGLVTLEPHQRWTETDITAHVLQGNTTGHLTLTAQYWCSDPRREQTTEPWWSWWLPFGERQVKTLQEPDVEAPSLLLYLEEQRDVDDWMEELFGREGEHFIKQIREWHPTVVRQRRSKELSKNNVLTLDVLKDRSTSFFLTSPSSSSSSVISDLPSYKRKVGMPKNRCKLHSFRLSFDKLGWGHYFIAPPVYNPRFCRGDCPRVLHYGFNSPNHAVIQNAIHELGIGEVPPPSCVPYKYLPLSVLVVHKKKVEYRELEDMVADSCTCR